MEVVGSIDSTNSELMRRARMGQTDPMVLVAIDQTAGRGRMGKTWHSTVGACLTFSVGLPLRPSDWSGPVSYTHLDVYKRQIPDSFLPPTHRSLGHFNCTLGGVCALASAT